VFEGRALLGLRRASRDAETEDSIVLSLGGNMSEVLSREKGRARNKELNFQCGEICAVQLSVGISWRRRHVETQRNPADLGSQKADAGLLRPGAVERLGGRRRCAERRRVEGVSTHVGSKLPREYSELPIFSIPVPKYSASGTTVSFRSDNTPPP
jgi:hypothetical protein